MYKPDSPTSEQREALRSRPVEKTPIIYQEWHELLFLHWEYPEQEIQNTLPQGLHCDTFNGKAYLGIVPFFLKNFTAKGLPAIPFLSDFLELNVRTYVYDEKGVAGIWFYSLDANQLLAVQGAKTVFHLPYFHSQMEAEKLGKKIIFKSQRYNMSDRFESNLIYEPEGEPFAAMRDTLEYFLAERYVLFSYKEKDNALYYGRINHKPYNLYQCRLEKWDANPIIIDGFDKPQRVPDHVMYADKQEVDTYYLEKVYG